MFDNIAEIRKTRKEYNLQMFRSGIGTFREFEEVEAHAFRDGALDRKHKELIGMAVGISNRCYGCIEHHVTNAVELGAGRKEILEAAAVAMVIGGGNAQWPTRFVFKVLEDLKQSGKLETEKES